MSFDGTAVPVCPFDFADALEFDPGAGLARAAGPVSRIRLPYGEAEAWLVTSFAGVRQVTCDPRFSRAAIVGRDLSEDDARAHRVAGVDQRDGPAARHPVCGMSRPRRSPASGWRPCGRPWTGWWPGCYHDGRGGTAGGPGDPSVGTAPPPDDLRTARRPRGRPRRAARTPCGCWPPLRTPGRTRPTPNQPPEVLRGTDPGPAEGARRGPAQRDGHGRGAAGRGAAQRRRTGGPGRHADPQRQRHRDLPDQQHRLSAADPARGAGPARARPRPVPRRAGGTAAVHPPSARGVGIPRIALEDAEIEGTAIKAGDYVHVSYLAANRDPAVFPDPHRLDLERPVHPHTDVRLGRAPLPGRPAGPGGTGQRGHRPAWPASPTCVWTSTPPTSSGTPGPSAASPLRLPVTW